MDMIFKFTWKWTSNNQNNLDKEKQIVGLTHFNFKTCHKARESKLATKLENQNSIEPA